MVGEFPVTLVHVAYLLKFWSSRLSVLCTNHILSFSNEETGWIVVWCVKDFYSQIIVNKINNCICSLIEIDKQSDYRTKRCYLQFLCIIIPKINKSKWLEIIGQFHCIIVSYICGCLEVPDPAIGWSDNDTLSLNRTLHAYNVRLEIDITNIIILSLHLKGPW